MQMLTTRQSARLHLVEEHVRCENTHDLDGLLRTFGDVAEYDDTPWCDRRVGRDQVRAYYAELMQAVPDLEIDVQRKHVTEDEIILEVFILGTHRRPWRGLPATGRRVKIPLCGVFTFDGDDRLAAERIYYDRATVLAQLGVFHDPESLLGKALTAVTHPLTMARIAGRQALMSAGDYLQRSSGRRRHD